MYMAAKRQRKLLYWRYVRRSIHVYIEFNFQD